MKADEADEKIVMQPTGNKNEIRVSINRDPAIKRKQEESENK